MVQGSNPRGSDIFRTRPDQPWGPPSLLSRPALGPTQPPVQTSPGAHPASCPDQPWGPPSLLSRPALGPTQPPVQTSPGAHPASCPDQPWGPPSLLYKGTGSFP